MALKQPKLLDIFRGVLFVLACFVLFHVIAWLYYDVVPVGPRQCRRVVLFSMQRSGSGWLQDTLSSHPRMWFDTEILVGKDKGRFYNFVAREIEQSSWKSKHKRTKISRQWVTAFLDDYWNSTLSRCLEHNVVCGFKLMYSQMRLFPTIWRYLRQQDVCIIHLVRENILDIELSDVRATSTRIAHCRSKERTRCNVTAQRQQSYKLNVDTLRRKLGVRLRAQQHARLDLRYNRLKTLEVHYETLLHQQQEWLQSYNVSGDHVQHPFPVENGLARQDVQPPPKASEDDWCKLLLFLGQPCEDRALLRSIHQKMITRPHRETISNFDEVVKKLSRSRYNVYL